MGQRNPGRVEGCGLSWFIPLFITGWWYTYPSENCEFVSWDYSSQYMEKQCSKPPLVMQNFFHQHFLGPKGSYPRGNQDVENGPLMDDFHIPQKGYHPDKEITIGEY